MAGLRPLAVRCWRWFTGPASVAALALVGVYLLLVLLGPPLAALWLLWKAGPLLLWRLAAQAPGTPPPSALDYLGLAIRIAALAVAWLLARRWLPPFRWRY